MHADTKEKIVKEVFEKREETCVPGILRDAADGGLGNGRQRLAGVEALVRGDDHVRERPIYRYAYSKKEKIKEE